MDLLKIGLIADTSKAIEGMEKTAKSVNTLGNALISGKKVAHEYGLALDQKLAEISEKVSSGLISNQKGIEQSYKLLAEQRAKMLAGMGEESKEYKTLVTYSDAYKKELDRLNAAQEKQASTTKAVGAAQSSVDKTTKEVTRSYKEQTTYLQKLFSVVKNILTFQLLMGPIRNGLRGIKDTLRESVSVAAEAEQRYNKLATVFDHFSESARQVSASLATVLGVAGSTSASALSTVGDLLQAQGMGESQSLSMSAEWVKQFQDIIAFKDINMSLEEFAQNFMSGAAGNLRNFRTFGSIVKESAVNARLAAQGLDKLTGSQLELAKMTARANIALEQQKNAMGATEREWDTMLSINRRLDEQSKRFKENMGDTINTVLKPFKEMWVEILDTINDAADASKMVGAHANNMVADVPRKLYDISDPNAADFWERVMRENIGGFANYADMLANEKYTSDYESINATLDATAETILKTFAEFGMDLSTGWNLISDQFSSILDDDWWQVDVRNALLTRLAPKGARLTDYLNKDDNYRTLESSYDRYAALIEAISGMRVAGTPTASIWDLDYWSKSSGGTSSLLATIAGTSRAAGSNALDNITGADLAKTWGDAVAIALDGVDKGNLLEGKANSLKTLYGIILEYMPEETDLLEKVAKAYRDTNKDLADYNASIEAQKNALSAMNNIVASAAERAGVKAYTDQGYSSEVASLMYARDQAESSVRSNWSTLYGTNAYAEIDGELRSLSDVIKMATEAYDEQIKAINDAIEAERRKAYGNALGTITGGMQNYKTQLRQLGMTEDQKAVDELWHGFQKLVDSLDLTESEIEAMNLAYDEEEKALRELQKATKEAQKEEWRKAFGNSINPAASYIDAYKKGKENLDFKGGGVVALLVELLKNAEAFQTLMSIIQDNVVPIMDAILKPLLPALRVLTQFMDNLPWDVLFTVFQAVSATLVIALDVISRILGTISAVVKTIYYAITFQWGKIGNVWEDFIDDQRKITNRTENALNEIAGMVFHIERNTDKDNLATLRELYANKVINEDQFYKGAGALQRSQIYKSVSPSGQSYVSYGGVVINVNGGDPQAVRKVLEEVLNENNISYNTAYGR